MEKSCACVGRVLEIYPIDGADRIESLCVICGERGKWYGTAQKGLFKKNDHCEVYLQDALLPQIPRFEFMKDSKYVVKMRKFKGVPSEVLIMEYTLEGSLKVGESIDNLIGVEKYDKPIPACLNSDAKGNFPSFIPKTDELNYQGVRKMVDYLVGKPFYSTLKIDGTSCTIYSFNGNFGVCSRNLERKEDLNCVLWRMAYEHRLRNVLRYQNYAIQMEVYGPGIQKNPCGANKTMIAIFDIFDIDKQTYFNAEDLKKFCNKYELPMAPIVKWNGVFALEGLQESAELKYSNGKWAEGIVVRPMSESIFERNGHKNRLSFKVINLNYK